MSRWQNYKLEGNPIAKGGSIVRGDHYRFTVLTPHMIRLEYNLAGIFEDKATQIVIHRDFPIVDYRVEETVDSLEIITEGIHLTYNKKEFSKSGLSIQVRGNHSAYRSIWYYGEKSENLKGTARTLDESNGAVELDEGLLSRNGYSVIDDSRSMVIEEDGFVSPRGNDVVDIYFLGYGRNYLGCLKNFYILCGATPMIPRYALGNWWSRFYPYTDEEYKQLINRFSNEKIPFSVSVLDMDWHLTEQDMDPKYGSGWTGYTWNKRLIKDPKAHLEWLHKEGLHVTLNVHPADGVRAHEEMYTTMAKELGVNDQEEDKIPFDISNQDFLEAYFKYLHHPNEEIGVDFWWVDWQQNGGSKVEGLDPLWMLNHYHYLDNKRNGKRAMAFSRYAGLGSHRYPIGFSGDSFATWETLDFQPYFTATASNAGYGWWSHDIGGHMHGTKNDEMAARWLQFGVFSPIMRIHSSDNPFNEKEPWKYNAIVEQSMKEFLRFRHQLIPYLYTMNYLFSTKGEPLLQPMYYQNSEITEAYEVPNQYYFGTELIACPITKPVNADTGLAVFHGWLPEGNYFDIFNGRYYTGSRRIDLYRDVTAIPVLAKAGSILPLTGEDSIQNSTENPVDLEIRIFAGDNGKFELYEDNSLKQTGRNNQFIDRKEVITNMSFQWGSQAEFSIQGVQPDSEVIPSYRNYTLIFYGFESITELKVVCNGQEWSGNYTEDNDQNTIKLILNEIDVSESLSVTIGNSGNVSANHILKQTFDLLNHAQIEFDLKSTIYKVIKKHCNYVHMLGELQALGLKEELLGALVEIVIA